MDRAHDVEDVVFDGTLMLLRVDGKEYEIDIAEQSKRLAEATQEQRERFEISPSGCGIHWPEIDADFSIDGLVGIRHLFPSVAETK